MATPTRTKSTARLEIPCYDDYEATALQKSLYRNILTAAKMQGDVLGPLGEMVMVVRVSKARKDDRRTVGAGAAKRGTGTSAARKTAGTGASARKASGRKTGARKTGSRNR
jgi:hypothetical protein